MICKFYRLVGEERQPFCRLLNRRVACQGTIYRCESPEELHRACRAEDCEV
ncbi:MAG: hypothetical protein HYY85_00895 [Deltaproteobacteria bacterium]|nr:hypothetical protein [Deltaproteobacteria bacterium]